MDTGQIKDHREIVGSDGEHVGLIHHTEGDLIKCPRHDSWAMGQYHYLPLSAVTHVGEFVMLARTAVDDKRQWHGGA